MTTIKLKNGSGAPLAGDLVQGEPALDLTNKRLYTEDSGGSVIEVGTNPTSLTTGTFTSTGIDDNATSTAITIDASENVGIGKAPDAWGSDWTALDLSYGTSLASFDSGGFPDTWLIANGYNDNTQWIATDTDQSCAMELLATTGTIRFLNTTSNTTAGSSFTWNETMRIDSSGNVGIGTSSPAEKLHVSGSGGVYGRITETNTSGTVKAGLILERSSTNTDFLIENSGNLTFSTASDASTWTERMRVGSSGDVGIGETSPNSLARLALRSNSGITTTYSGTAYERAALFRSSALGSTLALGVEDRAGGDVLLASGSNGGDIVLGVRDGSVNSEAMRIDSSGNLLVGTTDPSPNGTATNAKFVVDHESSIWGGHFAAQTTSLQYQIVFSNPNGVVGRIETTGSATTYVTSSDVRLKENIVDAPSASSDIDAIQIRSYDWKADGEHQKYGVVAQELVNVAPEAVSQGETEDDTWGVDYSKLVPMLIKEIQELRARVAQLEEA